MIRKRKTSRTEQGQKNVAIPYTDRINNGGNFCGHNPLSPVFSLPKPAKKGKGGIPRVLTLCAERLQNYYNNPRKVIPSLDLANGSERRQRSERREACIRLLSALLKHVDLTTLQVGMPTAGGFMSYTVDYIAKQTGMTLKRVERALGDLKAAGLVTVTERRKLLPDGTWKGLAAVKTVSRHLFGAFGLTRMLKKERDKAAGRLKAKMESWAREKTTLTGKAKISLLLGALVKDLAGTSNNREGRVKADEIEYRKRLQLKALELKGKNPEWDTEKCFIEAEQVLGDA